MNESKRKRCGGRRVHVCVCVIIYLKFHFVAPVFSISSSSYPFFSPSPSTRSDAAAERPKKRENVLHVVIFIICDFARQASSIVEAGDFLKKKKNFSLKKEREPDSLLFFLLPYYLSFLHFFLPPFLLRAMWNAYIQPSLLSRRGLVGHLCFSGGAAIVPTTSSDSFGQSPTLSRRRVSKREGRAYVRL